MDGYRGDLQQWPGWLALCNLAARSALVVTEDMPVPPEADWLQALAQQLAGGRGLWAVDTACVVPMQLSKRAYERAGAFRSSTEGGPARASECGTPCIPFQLQCCHQGLGW